MARYKYQIITARISGGFRSKITCDGVPMPIRKYEGLYRNMFIPITEAQKRALRAEGTLVRITSSFNSLIDLRVENLRVTTQDR